MGKYSIKELERLSGIKAHTLRIWEKRYNLFEPNRTATNIRFYSDHDLRKLLSVSLLCNNGLKISKIVSMPEEEIKKSILEIQDEAIRNQKRIDDLIFPTVNLDEEFFNCLFAQYVDELGMEKTFTEVIHPFLEKIGVLWLCDEINPVQEHFITHIIRQKLSAAIDHLPMAEKNSPKVMLFLPEGEYHELGLLFLSYLFKKKGARVYYFGQSVPLSQIRTAADKVEPNYLLTYSIVHRKEGIEKILDQLASCKAQKIFFLENKYQSTFNICYPKIVNRIVHFDDALSSIN